jgi:hypothetical protein
MFIRLYNLLPSYISIHILHITSCIRRKLLFHQQKPKPSGHTTLDPHHDMAATSMLELTWIQRGIDMVCPVGRYCSNT